ncbi:hypothetical protein [Polaribacter sp. Asnod1-A03]|uniref:hypothetical protein n=1 Tax=Polaribacter sp. Asnod1-A03 TaxID=3160581 RepID=UPI00386A6F01
MNKIVLVICLFISSFIFSQTQDVNLNYINTNSVSVSVDSPEELQTINWDDIKSAFKDNDPESEISFEIKLKTKEKSKKDAKVKYDYSFKSTSKAKDVDSLIVRMKKGVNYINKLANKIKDEN